MTASIISIYLPSLEGGGAERVFVQLANEFAARGHRVDLTLASARGPYLDEISASVRIVDLKARGVLASLPGLVRYLRRERPDALLSALDHANLVALVARAAAFSGARCIISMRSVPTAVYEGDKSLDVWITLQLMRVAYRFADEVIANSRTAASEMLPFVSRDRLHTIYNPLDLAEIDELSRAAIEPPWGAATELPMILGVGSFAALKDFPTLIRAFSIVRSRRDCRLVVLGEGPDRAKLEAQICELGLERDVYLPGFVANPYAWMRSAAVFVSTSLTEGCPNALMQSLACGTPVVSTDSPGGSAEVLERGKWGRLAPVRDHRAIAEAIGATLDTKSRIDGRQRAKDFAIDGIAREYLRLLLPGREPANRAA